MSDESPNPDHYALVIGIDHYAKLPPLSGAVEDARKFVAWLLDKEGGGLPLKNVQLVKSQSGGTAAPPEATPNKNEIITACMRLGINEENQNKRIGKRLYFYFAGHGFSPTFDDVGMLMANAETILLEEMNIGLRPCRLFFRDQKQFDEIIFLLDCCRNERNGVNTQKLGFSFKASTLTTSVSDLVVMAAVYGGEAFAPINNGTQKRQGLLTTALLEGLEGAATDPLGRVTAVSLTDYVKRRVPEIATEAELKQRPSSYQEPDGQDLVLATVPPEKLPRLQLHVSAPPGIGGDLVLLDGANLQSKPLASIPADQATKENPWQIEILRSRLYKISHTKSDAFLLINPSDQPDPYVERFPKPRRAG